jgi:hypothetical protein
MKKNTNIQFAKLLIRFIPHRKKQTRYKTTNLNNNPQRIVYTRASVLTRTINYELWNGNAYFFICYLCWLVLVLQDCIWVNLFYKFTKKVILCPQGTLQTIDFPYRVGLVFSMRYNLSEENTWVVKKRLFFRETKEAYQDS